MLRHFSSFSPQRCLLNSKREPTRQVCYLAYAVLATQCVVRSDGIRSAANLAALMAPEDQKSMHLQRLEDSNVHRLWRLINAFGKVRQGGLEKGN